MEKPFHSVAEQKLKTLLVSDIMSREPVTVDEDISLQSVAHILTKFRISGLPVVDSDGSLKGIITATDLLNTIKAIIARVDRQEDPFRELQVRVKEAMSAPVVTVTETQSLYDAARIMSEKDIHTLPVVRNGKIVGVVGRRDVLHLVFALR